MQVSVKEGVLPWRYPVLAAEAELRVPCEQQLDPQIRIQELESRIAQREREHAHELEGLRRSLIEEAGARSDSEERAWRERCARQLSETLRDFRATSDEYLARVEHEVVRLALAIAERVLHREAQMDPLLLSGAVRVALGQLAESTEVRLRIPADQRELWEEMLRLMPALPMRPAVIADPDLHGPEAVLEAQLGTIDLGVRAQITEIERGFFDLLDLRQGQSLGGVLPGKKG